ncbi:MAG: TonB-dependent receptor, partial [Flavisolibacter sp.]
SLIWTSYTFHDFHYKAFKQLTNDFSGKQMPGDPKHCIAAGYDLSFKNGIYGSVTYYYAHKIPLNDANTAFANNYHLLGSKIGFETSIKTLHLNVFGGGNNLLNTKYSLGNDLNAAAGRYYNTAAGINYYAGISVRWEKKQLVN